jgi:transcriptional regulator
MYSPQFAIETDRKKINEVITHNPFATLIFQKEGVPQSFHLPLVLDGEKLIGHMARVNTFWRDLDKNKVLIIFHGPHCYISPEWYGTDNNVPTWNYISIQVRGMVTIYHDEKYLRRALSSLGDKQEHGFNMEESIERNIDLLSLIVGIEISIEDIFAKFKLSQNKTVRERENICKALSESSDTTQLAVAKAIQATLI